MIYFLRNTDNGHIKIGFTEKDDADVRRDQCQTGNSGPLVVLATMPGGRNEERAMHMKFAAYGLEGEWFLPHPELLAIIPASGLPACGKYAVVEQSVQIRVLTVGRKQFSKALLHQIPEMDLIHWHDLLDWIHEEVPTGTKEVKGVPIKDYADNFDLSQHVRGKIWGWVHGGRDEQDINYRWIVFTHHGALYRHKDHLDVSAHLVDGHDRKLLKIIYNKRMQLPGWNDQLFFGV